jgi:signal transduction histidine kinase
LRDGHHGSSDELVTSVACSTAFAVREHPDVRPETALRLLLGRMLRRPSRFEARLGIASTVVIAVVCVGLSWQLARGALRDLRALLSQRGQSILSTLVREAGVALQRGDVEALADAAERAYAQGDVISVRIFDSGGLLLATSGHGLEPAGGGMQFSGDILPLPDLAPVERLGSARVVMSLAPLDALRHRILVTATTLTLLFMLVGAIGAWGVARALTRPLVDLARATAAVAGGDFSVRVAVPRTDELGTVATAFNAMATNLARSHQELQDKLRELERANHLKSEFLATVSHELRTPLNVIIGHTEMLAEASDGVPAEHARLVATIRRYAELQLELVASVLDFERLASGRVTCHADDFRMEPLVDDVLALQASRVRPGVQLHAQVSVDCPELHSDRTKVHQILRNLVDNAVKFTESGRVVIEVGPGSAPGHVAMAVVDTGPGVEPAELPHLFEPFRQVGPTSTRTTGGVGLGLSIVQRLARVLGGDVTVSSEPGWGSTFRVELPCRLPEHAPRDEPAGTAPPTSCAA